MTVWFNHRFDGSALTVEHGVRLSRRQTDVLSPRRLLGVLRTHRTH